MGCGGGANPSRADIEQTVTARVRGTAAVSGTATARSVPTATPRVAQYVDLTGRFVPRILRVGDRVTVTIGLTNKSAGPIQGLDIFADGPWSRFTILSVTPGFSLECGGLFSSSCTIRGASTVPSGSTATIELVLAANEPGNHTLGFLPRDGDRRELVNEKGESFSIEATIAVTR